MRTAIAEFRDELREWRILGALRKKWSGLLTIERLEVSLAPHKSLAYYCWLQHGGQEHCELLTTAVGIHRPSLLPFRVGALCLTKSHWSSVRRDGLFWALDRGLTGWLQSPHHAETATTGHVVPDKHREELREWRILDALRARWADVFMLERLEVSVASHTQLRSTAASPHSSATRTQTSRFQSMKFGPNYSSGLDPCQDAYNPPDSPDGRPVPDRERKSPNDEPKTTFEQPGSWKGDDSLLPFPESGRTANIRKRDALL